MSEAANILVVDDSSTSLCLLTQVLSAAGYRVHSAASGGDGIAAARAVCPDLILLDVRMEDMDGLEVCRCLKSQPETRDIPVILVSAFGRADERVAGLELGAADYVNKPFNVAELLARVRTQLSLGRTLALLKEQNAAIERSNEQLSAETVARQTVEDRLRRSLDHADQSRLALLSALEDEKRAQAELESTHAFLDSIIENIPDMVLIRDATDLRIVRVNRAAEALLGRARDGLLGKKPCELFPPPQAEFFERIDREVVDGRKIVEIPDEPILTPRGVRVLHTKKVPILGAGGEPAYVLGISVDVTERRHAQDAILGLSSRLEDILATVPEILMEVDCDHVYTWANDAGIRFFGPDVIGQPAAHYFVGEQRTNESVQPVFDGREDTVYVESLQRRKDGAPRWLAWWCRALKDPQGKVRGTLSSARDITESRKAEEEKLRLEEQLRVTQKMEAVGSLAGGVAHDFNNLLCVLQSYTEFAIRGVRPDDPVKEDLLAVKRAGERAAVLTRQLLAFGRRQILQPVVLSLNDVAAGMEKMLRRILCEDIEFVQHLARDLCLVRADQGQIEQVLMNLVVNARDAMPEGGQLTIETRNVEVDEDFVETRGGLPFGPYVELAVTDTGCGMDEQTMARIFDPFFTTKEKGKGTGLGLSTVYGIVKQSKGGIWVRSQVGKGTAFKIHLPRELEAMASAIRTAPGETRGTGTETILLVEDEEDLRQVAKRALEGSGYTVLSAADGDRGLKAAAEHAGEIDLLLTDVVMPRMGGRALAQRLRRTRPGIAILYMSGYTDDAIIRHGLLDADIQLIGKPFTATALTQRVRTVLDAAHGVSHRDGKPSADVAADEPAERPGRLAMEALPADVEASLRKAVASARYDEVMAIIDQIQGVAPLMAGSLRQRLQGFEYEGILELLDGKRSGVRDDQ